MKFLAISAMAGSFCEDSLDTDFHVGIKGGVILLSRDTLNERELSLTRGVRRTADTLAKF